MKEAIFCMTLLFAVFLGGCVVLPVPSFGIGQLNTEDLQSFEKGVTTRQEVLTTLGDPDCVFNSGRSLFFTGEYADFLLAWAVGLGPGAGGIGTIPLDEEHFAIFVAFDEQDRILSFEVFQENEESAPSLSDLAANGDRKAALVLATCWFYTEPLTEIVEQTGDLELAKTLAVNFQEYGPLMKLAQRDEEAQKYLQDNPLLENDSEPTRKSELRRQWREYTRNPASNTLADLCALAEKGSPEAKNELGRLYEYGLRGLPKDKGYALFWYQFSGYMNASDVAFLSGRFPRETLVESQRLLNTWEPGQCWSSVKAQLQGNLN